MKLSVVISIYNEEEVIPHLRSRLVNVFNNKSFDYEITAIGDGSTDRSVEFIKDWIRTNHRVSLIQLSRKFGHQQAITAGLHEITSDAVAILDADLQDPPEIILQMISKWKEGFKVVIAKRIDRNDRFLRKLFFKLFYKVFVIISDLQVLVNSGVFGLMDRIVVNKLLTLEERNRFLPGLRGWIGFETAKIRYQRDERVSGKPKQTFTRLFQYALNAIFSFSYKPLRISFFLGCLISTFFFLYGVVLVIMRILNINVVRGFTTSTVAIFFIGGVLLISNGIIGEYLLRIYDEVKRRPLYIISRRISREIDGNLTIKDAT